MAMVKGCIVAIDMLRSNPQACRLPFQLDQFRPTDERDNVDYADPGLELIFSHRVRQATLEPAVDVLTYSPSGDELRVRGEWRKTGPTRYRFQPAGPLYSGTTYLAAVRGGPQGVLSEDDARLAEDNEWSFSTMLDLAMQAPDGDDPVRLHNFQVVRDDALTRAKPTLTRTYFSWKKHAEVADDMQPDSFRMRILANVDYPRRVGQMGLPPDGTSLRIWRHDDPDVFSAEDRRTARHTANFFGWRPDESGVLEFVVEPHHPFPRAQEAARYEARRSYDVWSPPAGSLTMHYSFARVGAWRDGVPAARRAFAAQVMADAARQAPGFFPHRAARAVSRSDMPPVSQETVPGLLYDADGKPLPLPSAQDNDAGTPSQGATTTTPFQPFVCAMLQKLVPSPPAPPDRTSTQGGRLAAYLDQALADWYQLHRNASTLDALVSPGDLVVLFVPEDFLDATVGGFGLGKAVYANGRRSFGFPGMRVQLITLFRDNDDVAQATQVVLHEAGHEMGLEHRPGDARTPGECPAAGSVASADLQGRRADIEAWRMTEDGLSGWNKSKEEGNGQVPDNTLVSLMWPYGEPLRYMSLGHEEYERIRQSIVSGPADVWQQSQAARRSQHAGLPMAAVYKPHAGTMETRPAVYRPGLAPVASYQLTAASAQPNEERLVIVGHISPDALDIHDITRQPDRWSGPELPGHVARLFDAQGDEIASAPLNALGPAWSTAREASGQKVADWMRFRVSLPVRDDAARLLIQANGKVRAQLKASGKPAAGAGLQWAHGAEGAIQLSWPAHAGGKLADIAYSPTGAGPWQRVASGVSGGQFTLLPASVIPGPAPAVRLSWRDGPRFIDHPMALPQGWPKRSVMLDVPGPGRFGKGEPASLRFSTPMPWAELASRVTARDARGRELGLRVLPVPEAMMLSLLPEKPHAVEAPVHLRLPDDLRDVFGVQVVQPEGGFVLP